MQAVASHVRGLVKKSAAELGEAVELFERAGRGFAQISALGKYASHDLTMCHRVRLGTLAS
jgi:hypothetical protein